MEDRAKKDTKFINPLNDSEQKKEEKDGGDSEFSEGEDEDMEVVEGVEGWQKGTAEERYRKTRQEIESKYFAV